MSLGSPGGPRESSGNAGKALKTQKVYPGCLGGSGCSPGVLLALGVVLRTDLGGGNVDIPVGLQVFLRSVCLVLFIFFHAICFLTIVNKNAFIFSTSSERRTC